VAPAEQEVAHEHGGRLAVLGGRAVPAAVVVQRGEGAVDARATAAEVRVVHDVVVHEGGGVEGLEPARDVHDGRQVPVAVGGGERIVVGGDRAHGSPAPVAEQRAEALAAAQQTRGAFPDDVQVGRDGEEFRGPVGE